MPFKSINSTNPRTNPWKFHEKILRIGRAGKRGFFEASILNLLSRPFWTFFYLISVKNAALSYEISFFSALWMVLPESWKRSCPNFYAHDCMYLETEFSVVFLRWKWLGSFVNYNELFKPYYVINRSCFSQRYLQNTVHVHW